MIGRGGALAVALLAMAGCAGNPAVPSGSGAPALLSPSAKVLVKIDHYAYSPATITVKVGTTVKFVNRDPVTHTVTAYNGKSFASPLIEPGQSWKHRFKTAGKFKYFCTVHSYMVGIVKVTK